MQDESLEVCRLSCNSWQSASSEEYGSMRYWADWQVDLERCSINNAHVWDDSNCSILVPVKGKVMFIPTSELPGILAETFPIVTVNEKISPEKEATGHVLINLRVVYYVRRITLIGTSFQSFQLRSCPQSRNLGSPTVAQSTPVELPLSLLVWPENLGNAWRVYVDSPEQIGGIPHQCPCTSKKHG